MGGFPCCKDLARSFAAALGQAEGDRAKPRRVDHAGQRANRFARIVDELSPGVQTGVQAVSNERTVDPPVGANTGDDLLPDVAALGVADGPHLQAGLGRQRVVVHVDPKPRNACLDPRNLRRLPTCKTTPLRLDRLGQALGGLGQAFLGNVQVGTGGAIPAVVHYINLQVVERRLAVRK